MDIKAEDLLRAADAVTRESERAKGLAFAGEVMTRLGAVMNSEQEAVERAAKANAEADRLTASLADVQAGLDQKMADAKKQREFVIAEAERSKSEILAGLDDLKKAAQADAEVTRAEAAREAREIFEAAMERKSNIDVVANERQAEYDELAARITLANGEYALITEKIAQAKAAAKAMLE